MADVIAIPIDQVHVPEDYVRPHDEAAATLLMRQMESDGQKTPIAVYKSAARGDGKRFTLIYGARRLWAAQRLGWTAIDALLRTKDEAASLAIVDNMAQSQLNALEAAEHFAAYRAWWETTFGAIEPGRRKKSGQDGRIGESLNFAAKSLFYKDIAEKFGISEREGRRRYSIRHLGPTLREAVRHTAHADDQTRLIKLAKLQPEEQRLIAEKLRDNPDLEAVLREPDPETGRKGVGRMETGDWREQQFIEAWEAMPRDRRAAALEKIGAVAKPLDPWPAHFPAPEPLLSPGNASPLWHMMRDPYRTLHTLPTYSDILAARQERAEEEQGQERLEKLETWEKITARERETKPDYERAVAKGKASKKRKSKPGRKPDPPHVKREKAFKKLFIAELVTNLLEHEEVGITHWAVKYCRELDAKEQFWVACHLANGHSVEAIRWRVESNREEEALSLQSEIDFEAASKPVGAI